MSEFLITGGSGFIGTNLIEHLERLGRSAASVDIKPPQRPGVTASHYDASIMDALAMERIISAESPRVVIHLAARTDTDSDEVADYDVNMAGTEIVAELCERLPSVQHLLHTSTQFVARPGVDVSDPLTFDPHTAYGQSKVVSEQVVRSVMRSTAWTIVRPTNIWGAWHPRYPYEFWRVVDRGLYLHPGRSQVTRTYGYVGNVVQQYVGIADADASLTSSAVIYLGDPPLDLSAWAQQFVLAITGRPMRYAPLSALRVLAVFGDALKVVGIRFPLTSSRLRSMTEDYVVPTREAVALTAEPISLDDGVRETVDWLRNKALIKRR